jgi:hypothetical protein
MDKDGYHGYDKDAWRESASDYERGFIDGMQKQAQSSVDKAVNAMAQPKQGEPVAYDKTEMNGFVQDLYDKKMQEGKHGHYETMFHVVYQAIKRSTPLQRTWVGLTVDEKDMIVDASNRDVFDAMTLAEAKLKEKNNA